MYGVPRIPVYQGDVNFKFVYKKIKPVGPIAPSPPWPRLGGTDFTRLVLKSVVNVFLLVRENASKDDKILDIFDDTGFPLLSDFT